MNWKQIVEKQNRDTYKLPEGWTPRAEIAEQLECSESRVLDHLRPSLKSGAVETQQFSVWNESLKRLERVTAFRVVENASAISQPTRAKGAWTALEIETARRMNKDGFTHKQIGEKLGRTRDAVQQKLKTL